MNISIAPTVGSRMRGSSASGLRSAKLCTLALLGFLFTAEIALSQATVGGFEGVWKVCYSPERKGVTEIDSGYLVLMPGGEYYDIGESCCYLEDMDPKPPYWETGQYELDGTTVVMRVKNYRGEKGVRRLNLLEQKRTVLFDGLDEEPRLRDVLSASNDVDYGFCRVYPSWPAREAPHDNRFQMPIGQGAGNGLGLQ